MTISNLFTRKPFRIAIQSIVMLIMMLVVFKLAKAPILTLNSYKHHRFNDYQIVPDTIHSEQIDSLVRVLAYKEALLELSENDSIQMVINLQEQTVSLQIHGVQIFQSKIKDSKTDPLLKNLYSELYYTMFSKPLEVFSIKSTIVKEPIVEVQAPKDTIEAELNAFQPDTLVQFPAFVKMELNNSINIYLEQSENPLLTDRKTKWRVRRNYSISVIKEFAKAAITFQPYYYHPSITVRIPVNDLRAIYRALPEKAYAVLYY